MRLGKMISIGSLGIREFYKRVSQKSQDQTITKIDAPKGFKHSSNENNMANTWRGILCAHTPNNLKTSAKYIQTITFFKNQISAKLSKVQASTLDEDIQAAEVLESIKQLARGKAAGPDLIATDFYHDFIEELTPILTILYNEVWNNDTVPKSFLQAKIYPLKKKGDSSNGMDYRPLSLLNTDYKILAKVVANRVKNVLPDIIGTNQNGFVHGRHLDDSLHILQAILQASKTKNYQQEDTEAMIIILDIMKAYDSLNREFLFEVLKWYKFPLKMRTFVQNTYTNNMTCFLVNGFVSRNIKQTSGIRQGCPLAPLLFILCIEVVIRAIQNDDFIEGIYFRKGDKTLVHKVSEFVDDTTLFMKNIDSWKKAKGIFNLFGSVSGLRIQPTKTAGLWLGKYENKPMNLDIKFLEEFEHTRCLGIMIGLQNMYSANWNRFEVRARSRLQLASQKTNSVPDRIQIVTTIFLPGFQFISKFILPREFTLNKLQNVVKHFYMARHY